jgi:outer membrane protein/protease secretion system outer membrane protein
VSVLVQQPVHALKGLPGEQLTLPALPSQEVEDWVRQAMQHSPELRALESRRDAARLDVAKAQTSRKPTLDLVGQVVRSSSENVLTPASRYQNHVLGLQFNVPIYTGGLIDSSVRQAAAELQRTEEALEGARRDLSVRVHREFRSFTEGQRRMQALVQALRSAEQLVISNRRAMQAGSRTLVDVLNAEQQQAQVRRDLAQTRYVTALSRLRLEMLVGEDPRESISRLNAAFTGS